MMNQLVKVLTNLWSWNKMRIANRQLWNRAVKNNSSMKKHYRKWWQNLRQSAFLWSPCSNSVRMRLRQTRSLWLQNWYLNPRTSHSWIHRSKLITEIRRLNKVTSKTWMPRALVALLPVAFIRQLVQGLEPLRLVELGDVLKVLLHQCSQGVP